MLLVMVWLSWGDRLNPCWPHARAVPCLLFYISSPFFFLFLVPSYIIFIIVGKIVLGHPVVLITYDWIYPRKYSWQCSDNYIRCQETNPGQPHIRQVPYHMIFFSLSRPGNSLFMLQILLIEESSLTFFFL